MDKWQMRGWMLTAGLMLAGVAGAAEQPERKKSSKTSDKPLVAEIAHFVLRAKTDNKTVMAAGSGGQCKACHDDNKK